MKITFFLAAFFSFFTNLAVAKNFIPTLKTINAVTLLPSTYGFRASGIPSMNLRAYITALQEQCAPLQAHIFDYPKAHVCAQVRTGVHPPEKTKRITIFSRGYAKQANSPNDMPRVGGGVYSAYHYLRDLCLHTPTIAFDYPDDPEHFNFGQDIDERCLALVYQELHNHWPSTNITLFGDCRGALLALKLATYNPEMVDTLILAAPLVRADDLIQQISSQYLGFLGAYGPSVLKNFFTWYFPNYDPSKDTLHTRLAHISGKRIFIAHREHDKVIPLESVKRLVRALRDQNEVYFLVVKNTNAPHSRLNTVVEFQMAINAFYRQYGMPYDQELADAGQSLLLQAQAYTFSI